MAKSSYFSQIFGKSPVTPIQSHIEIAINCVELLVPYFEAVMAENWDEAANVQSKIEKMEHEADDIKNDLRLNLPTSLFMPIDRRDILEVLDLQDSIANKTKDIAGLILGRKMKLPAALHESYMNFLTRCIAATKQAKKAVDHLDELFETGFKGDEATRVKAMIQELHDIEDETDSIQITIRAELYAIEAQLPPVDVMFIYEVIRWTGDLADAAQSTGNRLQLMLAK